MTNKEVCDIKDCNDEATDIIDWENIECYFSVNMCLQHYQYFVLDQNPALNNVIIRASEFENPIVEAPTFVWGL